MFLIKNISTKTRKSVSGQAKRKYSRRNGAGERSRTPDIFITSEALYQLSYAGIMPLIGTDAILVKHPRYCNLTAGQRVDLQPGVLGTQHA